MSPSVPDAVLFHGTDMVNSSVFLSFYLHVVLKQGLMKRASLEFVR